VKTHSTNQSIPRHNAAFTLAEVMVASSIFVMLMGSLVYTFLFGLHLQETTATKLGAHPSHGRNPLGDNDQDRFRRPCQFCSGWHQCASNRQLHADSHEHQYQ
jgi:hypothetical protein